MVYLVRVFTAILNSQNVDGGEGGEEGGKEGGGEGSEKNRPLPLTCISV